VKSLVSLWVCLWLHGCATNLMYEETEWRRGIDRENWQLCYKVLKDNGIPVIYYNRTAFRMPQDWGNVNSLRPFQVKELLHQNNCKRGLKGYWADY
jgi:hypothetical protein